ncbi:hypothetical protein VNO77_41792 [Canavalia gladiata]|uniref:Uncharacterized protein n=1 Tax=Canavalia gladiata TaxID=3824 RepID=A0AAN9PSA4_CANGL
MLRLFALSKKKLLDDYVILRYDSMDEPTATYVIETQVVLGMARITVVWWDLLLIPGILSSGAFPCCLACKAKLARGRLTSLCLHEGAWWNQGDPLLIACRGNPFHLRVTHYWANQLMAYSICIGVLHQDATSTSRSHVGSAWHCDIHISINVTLHMIHVIHSA